MRYEFPSVVAKEPTADVIVRDGVGKIYAKGDTNFTTPLPTYDRNGLLMQSVKTTHDGVTEEFFVDDQPVVWWHSGDYAFLISSFTGLVEAAQQAADAANSSRTAAESAQKAAEDAEAVVYGTDDTKVYAALHMDGQSRAEVQAILRALGLPGTTVDSFEPYKAILFADGTVRAVPTSVTAPAIPAVTEASASASLVKLAWGAIPGATSYKVLRNGGVLATTSNTSYRDRSGTTGQTYSYSVQAVNSYGMRSQPSAPVNLFLDPALNAPPVVKVATWPAVLPSSGSAIIRVNATDLDAQTLAYTLGVSAGSVRPTQDPSVWIFTL